jgi:hypothetical protein
MESETTQVVTRIIQETVGKILIPIERETEYKDAQKTT